MSFSLLVSAFPSPALFARSPAVLQLWLAGVSPCLCLRTRLLLQVRRSPKTRWRSGGTAQRVRRAQTVVAQGGNKQSNTKHACGQNGAHAWRHVRTYIFTALVRDSATAEDATFFSQIVNQLFN